MGYILPVTHFQYNDYQRRITKEKPTRHTIEGPFKVVLDMQHEQVKKNYPNVYARDGIQSLTKPKNKFEHTYKGKYIHFLI